MYGNVLGTGLAAAPATLALTGVGRTWVTVTAIVAFLLIAVGVTLLRTARLTPFTRPAGVVGAVVATTSTNAASMRSSNLR